jgi:hypothetical protein
MNVRWLVLGIALTAPAHLLGADVYKWIDAEGMIHYGAQPPLGAEATRVKVSRGGGSSAVPAQSDATASDAAASPDDAAEDNSEGDGAGQTSGVDPTEAAKVCADARRNLETLESYARIRERDAEGNVVVLTDEEKQARIAQAKELIETYC